MSLSSTIFSARTSRTALAFASIALSLLCLPAVAQQAARPAVSTPSSLSTSINAPAPTATTNLPAVFSSALEKAQIPLDSVAVWVQAVDDNASPRVAYRAGTLVSPASTMKLVSTYAALDRLGPAYTWNTRVYADGQLQGGTLRGNLYIKGGGDPKLVMERLWVLLRQLQQKGVQVVLGDIVLDHSAYDLPPHNAGAFDDEPLRPYNAAPDALLLNFKSVVMRFVPDSTAGVARVQVTPPMAHLEIPSTVPLANVRNCPTTWRQGLQLDVSQSGAWKLGGTYPAACGELNWPVAYPDPILYANKAIEGMWREMGGSITGQVRSGITPPGLKALITEPSLSLTEIVRDVNKYSNNVMADHVFLALANIGGANDQPATYTAAQTAVQTWWSRRIGNPANSLRIDNGSGLSRDARVTAHALGNMLKHAWQSPVMPELLASLPAAGVDGTLRRSKANAAAHLKTGSLRDVNAIAGYVHANNGKRYVLVAIVNHANAAAARGAAFDALIDWVAAP